MEYEKREGGLFFHSKLDRHFYSQRFHWLLFGMIKAPQAFLLYSVILSLATGNMIYIYRYIKYSTQYQSETQKLQEIQTKWQFFTQNYWKKLSSLVYNSLLCELYAIEALYNETEQKKYGLHLSTLKVQHENNT
jgi:hypothetical protein